MTSSRIGRGVCISMALIGLAAETFAAEVPPAAPAAKPFTLRVLDAGSKQPLANVQIKYSGENNKLLRANTDAEGKFVFNLPAAARTVYIQINDPTHVPMTLRWNPQQEPGKDSYDALLPIAVPISGRVQDEAGEPVAGATVAFSLRNDRGAEWPHPYIAVGQEQVTTDANGVWTFNQTPEDVSTLSMGVFHPQYVVSANNEAYYSYERVTDAAGLRDGSHAVTLKKGVAITGKVVDADGKPVLTASVAIGTDRFPSNIVPPVKVDAEGKFTLAANPGAPLTITATAKGKAPDLQVIQVTNTPPEVTMKLGAPQTLTGKVVDSDGKPLRGVSLSVDTWRGSRTIQKRMSTNAEGKFNWTEAPADEVLVDVFDGTHADNRNIKMSPGRENLVTLTAPLSVSATVVDDATGQPVPKFSVIWGIKFDDHQAISWQRGDFDGGGNDSISPGAFTREFKYSYPGIALRVEAPGYLPADSPAWSTKAGKVTHEFRLKQGRDVVGLVTDAEGKPLANVQALLGLPGRPLQLQNGTVPPYMRDGQVTRTDAAGRFSFSPQIGNYVIVLLSDTGYAEVKADQFKADAPKITLQPWGRIEGHAFIGSKPAADAQIDGYANRSGNFEEQPVVYPNYSARADDTGKFLFERVVPGMDIQIGRRVQFSANSYTSTGGSTASVKSGETKTVRIGGVGRPVVGKVTLEPSLAGQSWGGYHGSLMSTEQNRILPPQPEGFDKMTPEERRTYWSNWYKTDEGKAFRAKLAGQQRTTRHYNIVIEPDGSFRVDDVEPGTYSLNIQLQKPGNERRGMGGEMLALANTEVVVQPIANGTQSDEPAAVPDVIAKSLQHYQEQMNTRRNTTTAPASQRAP